jgi:TonB family protein
METLIYFGKVNLCWVLFYGCYWLFFRNHTFFRGNRLYLLFSLMISFALPLISFSETEIAAMPEVTYLISAAPQITIASTDPSPEAFPWNKALTAIYLLGFTFMFCRLIDGLYRLVKIIAQNEHLIFEDYTLILLPQHQSAAGSFSFFKWLVVSHQDYNHHLDTILRHEAVHVRQYHSLDVMLIEIIKTVFWFNPALWFYKKSMQEIHEYLADEQAPNKERYANFLVSYVLHSPIKALTNHFFNSSLLKARIKMIYKNRTSRWLLGKYLVIIPVLLLVISLTAARQHAISTTLFEEINNPINEENVPDENNDNILESESISAVVENISIKGKISDKNGSPVSNASVIVKNTKIGASSDREGNFELNNIPTDSKIVVSHVSYQTAEVEVKKSQTKYAITLLPADNVYDEIVVVTFPLVTSDKTADEKNSSDGSKKEYVIAEQKAEFPGGVQEMMKYFGRNIKYPTRAAKANVAGNVVISFVVNEYGHVQKAEVVKGLGYGLDEEASRVVWSMPKWRPAIQNGESVASQHTVPIKFQIESNEPVKDKRQGFMNYPNVDKIKLADQSSLGFKLESLDSANAREAKQDGATFMNYKIAKPALKVSNAGFYRYHIYGK